VWVCLLISGGNPVCAEVENNHEPARFPSLISAIRIKGPLDFCGEAIPLDNQTIRERMEKELLLSLWNRPQVILWLKRFSRYMPHIEKMLKDHDLPQDLKYVSIIESALRPHIRSPKGALGYWQFIKSTGLKYGLVINSRIDERRNLFASTKGAIRYFKALHNMFGSWTLAAAAYNMGEEGLKSQIMAQGISDYYKLYLPLETQRYIFKIVSAKLILTDPEQYGFILTRDDLYPLLQFDRVRIQSRRRVPLVLVARAAKTHFSVIKNLNPEIRGHYIYKGNHTILIPKGAAGGFEARYSTLRRHWEQKKSDCIYEVQQGDNLSMIADRFNIPLPLLAILNSRRLDKYIHPGDHLIVCPKTVRFKN
jgi:hypothetical protein